MRGCWVDGRTNDHQHYYFKKITKKLFSICEDSSQKTFPFSIFITNLTSYLIN